MGLLIKIDEESKTPLFRQIMEQVIGLVDSDALWTILQSGTISSRRYAVAG